MKLLYIANARIPTEKAHGIQIMKMAEAFVGAGAELEMLLPWRSNRPFRASADPFSYYGVRRTFPIRKVFSIDLTPLRIFGHFAFVWQIWSYALAVALAIGWRRADWYYFRDLAAAYLTLKIRPRLGRQTIVEVHTVSERRRRLYRALGERAALIVAISHGVQGALEICGVRPEKIIVARDAVDLAVFARLPSRDAARETLHLPADANLVVYTGNLFSWKGVDTLIEATPDLPDRTEVVIVGGSPDQLERVRRFTRGRAIEHVQLVGYQPPTDVPLYLAAADVLVLPTSVREPIGARFTSPLKLFEYMAAGRPIVASDVPSSREVLTEETAIFVRPDSASSLAEGIDRALRDQQFSSKISNNARNLVKQCTWSRRAELILARVKSSQF